MFREEKSPEDEIKAWQFWHSRQHSVKQRILDAGKVWHFDHKTLLRENENKEYINKDDAKGKYDKKKRNKRRTTHTHTYLIRTEQSSNDRWNWLSITWKHALAIN